MIGTPTSVNMHQLNDQQISELIEKKRLQQFHPDWGTLPHVYYENPHLIIQKFIPRNGAAEENGKNDCVVEAKVWMTHNTGMLQQTGFDRF